MKKFSSLLSIVAMVMVAVSCGKVEKILPKQDGEWQTTYQKIVTTDASGAVVDSEETSNVDSLGTVHFESDGTGHSHNPDGSTGDFTWAVNDDNDVLTITIADSASGSSVVMDWEILEFSNKEMKMENTLVFTAGITYTTVTNMTLERVK